MDKDNLSHQKLTSLPHGEHMQVFYWFVNLKIRYDHIINKLIVDAVFIGIRSKLRRLHRVICLELE